MDQDHAVCRTAILVQCVLSSCFVAFLLASHQINLQSCYEAKGVAGNIIPAIATTNAIIAGLQVSGGFVMTVPLVALS